MTYGLPQQTFSAVRRGAERCVSEPLTDGMLVQRASRGDSIAFSELVNRHYRRAVRVAYGLLHHAQDAEDVAQDAFARVHARLAEFNGASAFYTWLYRIVVNLSIDMMRRRQREHHVLAHDETAATQAANQEAVAMAYARAPDQALQRRQLSERLEQAFAGLPEIHRAVLVLRELEGFSYEEIAATLQIKKGTVMSRLFHARKAMQQSLADDRLDKKAAPEGGL